MTGTEGGRVPGGRGNGRRDGSGRPGPEVDGSGQDRAEGDGSVTAPRRRRGSRRAVRVSDVDRRLIERGLPPSWEEKVDTEDLTVRGGDGRDPDRGDGANDRRLLDNVPPHSQPRA